MRRRIATALLVALVLPVSVQAEGIGALFTLRAGPAYADAPARGTRHSVSAQRALDVVDVARDGEGRIWYRVVLPRAQQTVRGEGWVSLEPHAIKQGGAPVTVFTRIPEALQGRDGDDFSTVEVPPQALRLQGTSRDSEAFTPVRWHQVRYTMQRERRAWLREDAGIFRPAKDAAFLTRVHQEMTGENVERPKRMRLLSGVVHVGDAPREVEWALGTPDHTTEEDLGGTHRATWRYPSLRVVFENAVVKEID